jgi:hypothetical protein
MGWIDGLLAGGQIRPPKWARGNATWRRGSCQSSDGGASKGTQKAAPEAPVFAGRCSCNPRFIDNKLQDPAPPFPPPIQWVQCAEIWSERSGGKSWPAGLS